MSRSLLEMSRPFPLVPSLFFLLALLDASHVSLASPTAIFNCAGKRVFMHDLPLRFNSELVFYKPRDSNEGRVLAEDVMHILKLASVNSGFGREAPSEMGGSDLEGAWYQSDPNALERIFHSRMLTYPCRVLDHSQADLVYVPYFGRHDVLRHGVKDLLQRDRLSLELASWLKGQPAWERANGSDHFFVLGSPLWDFYRKPESDGWGNSLLKLDGLRGNVWAVTIETFWTESRVFSAPYPTGFHPKSAVQIERWQAFVRGQERKWLFSFVGARRPGSHSEGVLRNNLFWQCNNSASCGMIDCSKKHHSWRCHDVSQTYGMYLTSRFCLHPIGDSCTRRSLLDAALAGCIPVVFYPCTLKDQYDWHLHKVKEQKAFVFIPANSVQGPGNSSVEARSNGTGGVDLVRVEEVLRRIPEEEVQKMRETIVESIPDFTYGGELRGDSIAAPDFRDGIDIIVEGLTDKIKKSLSS